MIKINLLLVVVACASIEMAHAMDDVQASKIMNTDISLLKPSELKYFLRQVGLGDFVAKVKIHRQLSRPQLPLKTITEIVDQCIQWYDNPPLDWITENEKKLILKIVLFKSPDAYEQLYAMEESVRGMWSKL